VFSGQARIKRHRPVFHLVFQGNREVDELILLFHLDEGCFTPTSSSSSAAPSDSTPETVTNASTRFSFLEVFCRRRWEHLLQCSQSQLYPSIWSSSTRNVSGSGLAFFSSSSSDSRVLSRVLLHGKHRPSYQGVNILKLLDHLELFSETALVFGPESIHDDRFQDVAKWDFLNFGPLPTHLPVADARSRTGSWSPPAKSFEIDAHDSVYSLESHLSTMNSL